MIVYHIIPMYNIMATSNTHYPYHNASIIGDWSEPA